MLIIYHVVVLQTDPSFTKVKLNFLVETEEPFTARITDYRNGVKFGQTDWRFSPIGLILVNLTDSTEFNVLPNKDSKKLEGKNYLDKIEFRAMILPLNETITQFIEILYEGNK